MVLSLIRPESNFVLCKACWYSLDQIFFADNDPTQESQFGAQVLVALWLSSWP
jgi:hypothetical protein